jgi:solute carrier family 12 (sodium/potassium/chloride transporter), member 2
MKELQSTPSSEEPKDSKNGGLGTFGGVFTPSILTILGVIMYLRFGWVVGNVGLVNTLVIVTLSSSITLLTALSVCAIATDKVVRTGGAYYMISRALGIETGGAVGIPLYFAQAISVALYTLGFAESLALTYPHLNQQIVALVTTVLVAAIAVISARAATQAQFFIMAAIVVSLVSLALGASMPEVEPIALNVPKHGESFWIVFAVFFPAVTGIMSGVNMSGDLKEPSRSIPTGTLAAIGVSYIIYMTLPFVLAYRVDVNQLVSDRLVMLKISWWGDAILYGVWGATLSSAIGSIMGAPRVLQALARDGALPNSLSFLGKGSGANDEPRIGTAVTLCVALAAVLLGDLNLLAPVLSMFFLTTYLVLNITAFLEGFLASPSYRPSFQVHWFWSLLGAAGCIGVMVLINAVATVVAAFVVAAIYFWLETRELTTTWGDVRRGIWMNILRAGILKLSHETEDTKNWRPQIMVFSGAPSKRWALVNLANLLTHKRGLVTVVTVLPEGSRDLNQKAKLERTIKEYLEKRSVQGLVRVVSAPDPFSGAYQLVDSYGIGPLVPNTVVIGDNENEARRQQYCDLITNIHQANKNICILRENAEQDTGSRNSIHIWWGGMQRNGGLMMLLGHLLKSSIEWRKATLYINLVVKDEVAEKASLPRVQEFVDQLQIQAVPQVLRADGRPFAEILHETSKEADLILLGMASPETIDNFGDYYKNLHSWTEGLPNLLYVLAAPEFEFAELLYEGRVK